MPRRHGPRTDIDGDATVRARRLRAQRLSGTPFASPVEAVRGLTAVQAQDFAAARWAIGLRVAGATDASVGEAFDRGDILRTHVLRPTWHAVAREDLRWLLALTGPRVLAGVAARHRVLELDGAVVSRALDLVAQALAAAPDGLSRAELGEALRRGGVDASGQRLPHLLLVAELEALVVSGPRRGAHVTWVLLDDRAPAAAPRDRDEALRELALRYLRSHGPATLDDLAWWSGLTLADCRRGVALAGDGIVEETYGGRSHWSSAETEPARRTSTTLLLPNFDEYLVAYRDRSAALDGSQELDMSAFSFGSVLSNVVTVGGVVRGAWRRTATRHGVALRVHLAGPVTTGGRAAVEAAAERYAAFLGTRVEVTFAP